MNDTKYPTPGIGGGQGRRASNVAVSAMVFFGCVVTVAIAIAFGALLEWWNR